jgi:hypothetical protein
MKRVLSSIILTVFSLVAFAAGEKVVEASAKKAPDWLFGMETGYIITTAEGTTMEMARTLAMQAVKERIVSSVAEHIESEVSMMMSETTTNNDIEALTVFSKQVRSKSADIPFINDISEAHVEEYYWEKVQIEKNVYAYRYNIKYPFSSLKIRAIIMEFKEHQAELRRIAQERADKIQAFSQENFAGCNSVEEMIELSNKLNTFITTIPVDDQKSISTCHAIQQQYKKALAAIQIRVIEVTREYTEFELYFANKPISYYKTPKFKSNCLSEIAFVQGDLSSRIIYNYEAGCYEDDANNLEISYSILGNRIKQVVYIK